MGTCAHTCIVYRHDWCHAWTHTHTHTHTSAETTKLSLPYITAFMERRGGGEREREGEEGRGGNLVEPMEIQRAAVDIWYLE